MNTIRRRDIKIISLLWVFLITFGYNNITWCKSVNHTKDSNSANLYSRPFIWTRLSERENILARIRTYSWATAQFDILKNRANAIVTAYEDDRDDFLRLLPLSTSTGEPKFIPVTTVKGADGVLLQKFREGVDCAAMFYLTNEEKYARCAADIFHNSVLGYINLPPTTGTTAGGWIYSNGLLGEAAESGMYLPIIYDYLYNYLKDNPRVYQLTNTGGKEIVYGSKDFENAQTLFRTYYKLTRDRGLANNNWSPNMAKSLVPCVLALDDPNERNEALKDYLVRDNERQTSLKTDAKKYPNPGDIWPESLDYSQAVNTIHPYLMIMVDHYDTTLNLFNQYPNVVQGMARPYQFIYPNGRQIHFGDFHHDNNPQPYFLYELVYGYAEKRNLPNLRELYGPLINAGIDAGKYSRSTQTEKSPVSLFWFANTVNEPASSLHIPQTDILSHAGIVLQRNLSSTQNPVDGLMCFVGGGAHTHSHANGMDMELYGKGVTLGVDAGKGNYKSELHENYYRLFAGHNTIIVNGASSSEGGWVNLGINTVQVESMEPKPFQVGVSKYNSFSCTSFIDDKGTGAKATQQRTMAIVRTSPTTGYYVDVFRSKSAFDNQFHDYLYHNIGDTMTIENAQGPIKLTPSKDRYVPIKGAVWKSNESYLFPGWQYFINPQTSDITSNDVVVDFSANQLRPSAVHMRLFIPGMAGRDYTKAMAPETKLAAKPYDNQPTPVLVIRQNGEAWEHPFAMIFEPIERDKLSGSIKSVKILENKGEFAGFEIISTIDNETIIQYVIVLPTPTSLFEDKKLQILFKGRYAVITVNSHDKCTSLYIGEGGQLQFRNHDLHSLKNNVISVFADMQDGKATLASSEPAELILPTGKRFKSQ